MFHNPHLANLLSQADDRFSVDRSSMTYTDWIEANTTLRGKSFSVVGYEFQRAILDDMHANMDVRKCSQVGLTEGQIRKMLAFLKRNRSTTGIFTFPDEKTFKKNSATRIKPCLDDKVFNTARDKHAVRSIPLYQVGTSFLHVVMCQESDATSTPADIVFNDEVDLSDQSMLVLFNSRLQNSSFKIKQRFSTPTFPSFGIDLGFQASDQHVYMAKCEACNHWNNPEFNRHFICIPGLPDNIEELHHIDESIIDAIDVNGSYVRCEKCERALNLGDPSLRLWVPRFASRKHHRGYDVSPFVTSRLPPSYILTQLLEYQRRQYIRGFFNTVLGRPYSDGNIRLDEADINACFTQVSTAPRADKGDYYWLGIDMGQTCHLVLGRGPSVEKMEAVLFEAVPQGLLDARIEQLLNDFNIIGGCVDRLPYTPDAERIHALSKGKIVPAQYVQTKELNVVYDAFQNIDYVALNRTAALDTVQRVVKNRTLRMSGFGVQQTVISEHLRDMVRDEKPEEPAKWVKLTGVDHYFHALGYMLVAPRVKELERLKAKHDVRSMVLCAPVEVKEGRQNILDIKTKRPYQNPLLHSGP
jgi:hypothetical protein